MRWSVLVTRVANLDASWTTVHLVRAALQRGHEVAVIERHDLDIDPRGHLVARAFHILPHDVGVARRGASADLPKLVDGLRARRFPRRWIALRHQDLLLLRTAPLSHNALSMAMLAQAAGVRVVNDPAGLLAVTHKGWLASLGDVPTPATVVTRSHGVASTFYAGQPGGVVVKPARGSGGRAVALVPPRDGTTFDEAFRAARDPADGHVVVQAFVEAADRAEKRLLWLDGQILGGYLRHRRDGEFRHNLKQGGRPAPYEVTDADRALLAPLTPHLLARGIRFAGLDLLGDYVIEVNALNPGGTVHTDRTSGSDLASIVVRHLEGPGRDPHATETAAWVPPAP